MKQLFIIALSALLLSCQKEVLQPSITSQVASNAVLRAKGSEDLPIEYLLYNDCTAEWVVVEIVIAYKFNYFTTKDDFHANATYGIKGIAIGQTSGNIYKLTGKTLDIEKFKNYQTTENQVFRVTTTLTFKTPDGQDWVTTGTRIRRILADGTIVTDIESQTAYCKN